MKGQICAIFHLPDHSNHFVHSLWVNDAPPVAQRWRREAYFTRREQTNEQRTDQAPTKQCAVLAAPRGKLTRYQSYRGLAPRGAVA